MRYEIVALGCVLGVSVAGGASATTEETTELLYERAVTASQEGRNDAAAALFDEVLAKMTPTHPLRALALYGAARANQRVDTPEAACRAAERFRVFIALPDAEPEKRERAANALGGLTTKCRARDLVPVAAAPVVPPPAAESAPPAAVEAPVAPTSASDPDRTWAWATTGVAGASAVVGAVLLIVAGSALDDADAALARFEASGRTNTADRAAVRDADDRATTYGLAGYGLLGLGAALGGVATWLWLREPSAGVAFVPGPGGLGVVGRF
jgi:hypothetical protein